MTRSQEQNKRLAKPMPPLSHLEECFEYDNGILLWKERPMCHFKKARTWRMWNAKFALKRAGKTALRGTYRQVGLDSKLYLEHRLIAALHGMDCTGLIDHKDGDGLNNVVSNLRPAPGASNYRNHRISKNNTSGHIGVVPRGFRWTAYIRKDGRLASLGTFPSCEEAVAARRAAERTVYGEFSPRHD